MAPIIGISPYYYHLEDTFWMATKEAYAYRIWDNGGIPLLLTHPNANGSVSEIGDLIGGLLMIGGPDLPVEYYGGTPYDLKGEDPMHPNRVAFDRKIFEICRDQKKPILSICAGFQHINVIYGGTLYEDIPSQLPNAIDHGGYKGPTVHHPVEVDPHCTLHDIIGEEVLTVNSAHHQGVKKQGEGLKVTAWSSDGLVEAVEPSNGEATFLAVQWHPEKMENDPTQMKLFRWLIEETNSD